MRVRYEGLDKEIEKIRSEMGKLFWADSGEYVKDYSRLVKRHLKGVEIPMEVDMSVNVDKDRYPEEYERKVAEGMQKWENEYIPACNERALEIMDEMIQVNPGEGAEDLISLLIPFLGNEDEAVREKTIEALRAISAPLAFNYLCIRTAKGNLAEKYIGFRFLSAIEFEADEISGVDRAGEKMAKVAESMVNMFTDRRNDPKRVFYLLQAIKTWAPQFEQEFAPTTKVLELAALNAESPEEWEPILEVLTDLPNSFVDVMPRDESESLKKHIANYARTQYGSNSSFVQDKVLPALQNIAKQRYSHFDRLRQGDQAVLKAIEWVEGQ